jgi:Reverse transcriptase (RNA-dependent DNA polymerase).
MTQLNNNIHETGEWPKDFTEVTVIALKKNSKATKFCDHCTISLVAHTAKTAARTIRRFEMKTENVLGEDQFGFRRVQGTRNATGMLRIISQEILDLGEELCSCFIEWQKAFDHVNWFKLVQILKETSINWCKRRLISELYMGHNVEVQLNKGRTRSVKIGRGVR